MLEDQEREESGDNEKNVFLSECIRYVKNYPLESDYQFDDSEIENGLVSKLKDNKRNMEKIRHVLIFCERREPHAQASYSAQSEIFRC